MKNLYHTIVPDIYSLNLEGLTTSEIVAEVFERYQVVVTPATVREAVNLFELDLQLLQPADELITLKDPNELSQP